MNGVAPRLCRGLSLPSLAAVLLAGGVLWLAAATVTPPRASDDVRERLLAARRSLLAHASAYPESYGPSGAGPAHLPCPDTDGWPPPAGDAATLTAAGGSASAGAFDGEGPDPPCGTGAVAVGWLPRHVSLPSHRELFHRERARHLVYAVSTSVVNNPLDRVVNPASVALAPDASDEGELAAGRDAVVAVIVAPDRARAAVEVIARVAAARVEGDLGAHARLVAGAEAHVVLGRRMLVESAARHVAAWFVARATRRAGEACAGGRRALCWPRDLASGEPGAGADAVVSTDASADAGTNDGTGASESERRRVSGLALLAWIGDDDPPDADGDAVAAADGFGPDALPTTIEATARVRHWFVRNGWHRFVELAVDPRCRAGGPPCRLALVDAGSTIALALAPAGGRTGAARAADTADDDRRTP